MQAPRHDKKKKNTIYIETLKRNNFDRLGKNLFL